MGYRKAARMRRTQYVSGHYRTSKTGKTYWVGGHVRNDRPGNLDGCFQSFALFMGAAIHKLFVVVPTMAVDILLLSLGLRGKPRTAPKPRAEKQTDEACGDLHALIGSDSEGMGR